MDKVLIYAGSGDVKELTRLLANRYAVSGTETASEAIRLLEEVRPDVVLLAAALLDEQISDLFFSAPVICVAGGREEIVRAYSAGCADYIAKPYICTEVLARVSLHVDLLKLRAAVGENTATVERKNQQIQEAYQQLERVARIDLLTSLPNKPYMLERMRDEAARAFRNQKEFSIILARIDWFDSIKDNCGSAGADYILQMVADMLRKNRRGQDVVAYWGRDEFLLMLPETYRSDGGLVAERIRGCIENGKFNYAGENISVTVTLGVAEFDGEQGLEGTMRLAEEALNKGKAVGNCVVMT